MPRDITPPLWITDRFGEELRIDSGRIQPEVTIKTEPCSRRSEEIAEICLCEQEWQEVATSNDQPCAWNTRVGWAPRSQVALNEASAWQSLARQAERMRVCIDTDEETIRLIEECEEAPTAAAQLANWSVECAVEALPKGTVVVSPSG